MWVYIAFFSAFGVIPYVDDVFVDVFEVAKQPAW